MPINLIRAQANIQPITIPQMVAAAPDLFCISARFLMAEQQQAKAA